MDLKNCNNTKETDKIVFQELERAKELYKQYEQINQLRTLLNINDNVDENYNSFNWDHPLSISLTRIE
ncbi:MAG: hypothetical protein A2W19_06345 [Spirochaetes bacterium RBG_16_49_21]|nr:MAG: hypothetical protein A2W19_06345 [Spirochaetes bacterium RBG_16_49_21]